MDISRNTSIEQIRAMMGNEADRKDARLMLELLIEQGVTDTDSLTDDEWLRFEWLRFINTATRA